MSRLQAQKINQLDIELKNTKEEEARLLLEVSRLNQENANLLHTICRLVENLIKADEELTHRIAQIAVYRKHYLEVWKDKAKKSTAYTQLNLADKGNQNANDKL